MEVLRYIYACQLSLHYTPDVLRTSKIVFIPKLGKDDYCEAKSYRPISLTPFLFKLMERTAAWHIVNKVFKDSPLHKRQHAYRVGRSTESAISQVINQLEKGMYTKKFALASFIDISAAFDKLNPDKAVAALIKKGVPENIALWYRNYLKSRYLYVNLKGTSVWREIGIGCPQGGVLSTILWNVAFDDLLKLFDSNDRIGIVGYADDGSIIITGSDLKQMYAEMNAALVKCEEWAETYGLAISPEKTEYIFSLLWANC